MVKTVVLSEYSAEPPEQPGRFKILTPGRQPLYPLARVHHLARDEKRLFLWTRRCRLNVHELFDSDLDRVAELVLSLRPEGYIDSEWCENGQGGLAACDAYRTRRQETMAATGQPVTVEYFVKFAIGKTGQLLLLVSCHL